ncbi:Uncharacterised protein [Klebsiella pneumoniae]|uniref:Uncharacterized protein n=1 Tax=Klebsiella pneumoniae TaxID=573 RepID=A0A377UU82_KLEPN|nr:Uncharacterised protein [Klebsiella pneumoniae]
MLNGRVRSAVHWPDASSCCCTVSRGSSASASAGVTGKRHRVIALDINHHRLQHAPFAAVDRADDPARRGGKADARDLFIFEQDLTFFDPIAFFNRHRGTHANVLFAE